LKVQWMVAVIRSIYRIMVFLAIWMAQTYLAPLSSIAPAAYVLWQNLINSWQLWRAKNKEGVG